MLVGGFRMLVQHLCSVFADFVSCLRVLRYRYPADVWAFKDFWFINNRCGCLG